MQGGLTIVGRIDFDVDSNTAKQMNAFFAVKGLSKILIPKNSVSFSGSIASISIPCGFSLSWDAEKDPRIIPNLVEAIFDAIEIFRNRIKGIKVDGNSCSTDEAKAILGTSRENFSRSIEEDSGLS